MSFLSISAAARATGKNRVTLQKHIKSGKLSVTRGVAGKPVVDVAELLRVYGPLQSDGITATVASATEISTEQQVTIQILQEQLRAAQEREEWLKRQLEAEQERSRELERRMLPPAQDANAPVEQEDEPEFPEWHPRSSKYEGYKKVMEKKKGFFAWLFGS